MLSIQVDIQGDKAMVRALRSLGADLPRPIRRGLTRIAKGTHRGAYDWLSGAGAKASGVGGGGYPVPVRTGHLRRSLDWLAPGSSKGSFSAGQNEVVVFDSAVYSEAIHEGRGSSAKFGARPFLVDGFRQFNEGDRATEIMEEEIGLEIKRKGLR